MFFRSPLRVALVAVGTVAALIALTGCSGPELWRGERRSPSSPALGQSFSSAAELGAGVRAALEKAGGYRVRMVVSTALFEDDVVTELHVGAGDEPVLRFVQGDFVVAVFGSDAYVTWGKRIDGRRWVRVRPGADDPAAESLSQYIDGLRMLSRPPGTSFPGPARLRYTGAPTADGYERYRVEVEGDRPGDLQDEVIALVEKGFGLAVTDEWREQFRGAAAYFDVRLDGADRPIDVHVEISDPSWILRADVSFDRWGEVPAVQRPKRADTWDSTEVVP